VLAVGFGSAIAAQTDLPSISAPDTSKPAVAAFVAWHAAMVKGDFATYRSLTPEVPGMPVDALKQMFDQIRLSAPKTVKISEPKLNERGSVEFSSVGCNGSRPVVSIVAVRKMGDTWRVAGSGWGPSWNSKISEIIKCT
jgi:hypothetical protein